MLPIFETLEDKARFYAGLGLSLDTIADTLRLHSSDICLCNQTAKTVFEEIPDDLRTENPPRSFLDISNKIKRTIESAPIEKIEEYFNKYGNPDFTKKILDAREKKSDVSDILEDLEPLIIDLLVTNNALSNEAIKNTPWVRADEKERLEQELFGVWSVYSIIQKKKIDKGDKLLLKKSKLEEQNTATE